MDTSRYYRSNSWNMVKLVSHIFFDHLIVFSIFTPVQANFVSLTEPI